MSLQLSLLAPPRARVYGDVRLPDLITLRPKVQSIADAISALEAGEEYGSSEEAMRVLRLGLRGLYPSTPNAKASGRNPHAAPRRKDDRRG